MQEVATFPPPSANSLTLVPARTTEYIVLEIAKLLFLCPQKSEGISTFSERRLQVFPICCYSLAVTAGKRAFRRRVLRRPHPAQREVTCGYTDMDWPRLGAVLHTTGLWGRSYLGVGRRAASRTWQRALSKRRHGFTNTRGGQPHRTCILRGCKPIPRCCDRHPIFSYAQWSDTFGKLSGYKINWTNPYLCPLI